MPKLLDLTGAKFGRLTALRRVPKETGRARNKWVCLCDCGAVVEVEVSHLRDGHTKSCSCLKVDAPKGLGHPPGSANHTYKHGAANSGDKTYWAWVSMRSRCHYKPHISYKNYGGRGLTVCSRWEDFETFLLDMGPAPDGMSLDRVDNDAGYSPDNCRWANRTQQSRNRRGVKLSLQDARDIRSAARSAVSMAKHYGVTRQTIYYVLKHKIWKEGNYDETN